MSRQVFILLEAIALAAMIALPPRWVKYGECCYGEGSIPGVNCWAARNWILTRRI